MSSYGSYALLHAAYRPLVVSGSSTRQATLPMSNCHSAETIVYLHHRVVAHARRGRKPTLLKSAGWVFIQQQVLKLRFTLIHFMFNLAYCIWFSIYGSASAGPFAYSWGLMNTIPFDWEIKTVTAAGRNRGERRRVIRGIGERNPQQVPWEKT